MTYIIGSVIYTSFIFVVPKDEIQSAFLFIQFLRLLRDHIENQECTDHCHHLLFDIFYSNCSRSIDLQSGTSLLLEKER